MSRDMGIGFRYMQIYVLLCTLAWLINTGCKVVPYYMIMAKNRQLNKMVIGR